MRSERKNKTFSQGNFIMSYTIRRYKRAAVYARTQSHRYTLAHAHWRMRQVNEKGTTLMSTAMATATMTTQKEKHAHQRMNEQKQKCYSPNGFRFFIYCLHSSGTFFHPLYSAVSKFFSFTSLRVAFFFLLLFSCCCCFFIRIAI